MQNESLQIPETPAHGTGNPIPCNQNTPALEPSPDAADEKQPRIFSQQEMSRIAAKEAGKAERSLLRLLGLTSRDEAKTLAEELPGLRGQAGDNTGLAQKLAQLEEEYSKTSAQLKTLQNHHLLRSAGVPENALAYFTAQIEMNDAETDFETAMQAYFSKFPLQTAHFSTAPPMENTPPRPTKQEILNEPDTSKRLRAIQNNLDLFYNG